MLYREIIAVCSEIQTKHINTLCGQNVKCVCVKPGGTNSYRCTQPHAIYSPDQYLSNRTPLPVSFKYVLINLTSCVVGLYQL